MSFVLPDLPYEKSALAPHMSAETLDYHHGKHHKAYIDKTNAAIGEMGLDGLSLVEIAARAKRDGDAGLFNNAAQAWNHSFFWRCLAPGGARPSPALQRRIDDAFGSTGDMAAQLKEQGAKHFSNGWAWLVLKGDTLAVTTTHDADTPIAGSDMRPLLTIDLWEHAYYIDYRQDRAKWLATWWDNLANWRFAERQYAAALGQEDEWRFASTIQ